MAALPPYSPSASSASSQTVEASLGHRVPTVCRCCTYGLQGATKALARGKILRWLPCTIPWPPTPPLGPRAPSCPTRIATVAGRLGHRRRRIWVEIASGCRAELCTIAVIALYLPPPSRDPGRPPPPIGTAPWLLLLENLVELSSCFPAVRASMPVAPATPAAGKCARRLPLIDHTRLPSPRPLPTVVSLGCFGSRSLFRPSETPTTPPNINTDISRA